MIRYGVVRRAQQSQPAHSSIFAWRSYGSGGSGPTPPATHRRLYHNWLFYGGWYNNVIVWQNAGSGGVTPPTTGVSEYVYYCIHRGFR